MPSIVPSFRQNLTPDFSLVDSAKGTEEAFYQNNPHLPTTHFQLRSTPPPWYPPLQQMGLLLLQVLLMWTSNAGKERSMHPLRGSGTCKQDRLNQPYAEKCLLEFSASGPIWADDVQWPVASSLSSAVPPVSLLSDLLTLNRLIGSICFVLF